MGGRVSGTVFAAAVGIDGGRVSGTVGPAPVGISDAADGIAGGRVSGTVFAAAVGIAGGRVSGTVGPAAVGISVLGFGSSATGGEYRLTRGSGGGRGAPSERTPTGTAGR
jgi:hypothetical protein